MGRASSPPRWCGVSKRKRATLSVKLADALFAGTTNRSDYPQDPTGDRRFWPVRTGVTDPDTLGHDRDQPWAEGVVALSQRGLAAERCNSVGGSRRAGQSWRR
ncbi:VapE domain-containing protein [Aliiruegeria haliotis]|uniref:VapE domain-containing protein n=1 Tax=Aliiruegeria haliotis TaxID=1280846 RepID=UPI000D05A885